MLSLTAFVVQVNILAVRLHGLGERDVGGEGGGGPAFSEVLEGLRWGNEV